MERETRRPSPLKELELDPGGPARPAVARILAALLDTLEANVGGTLADRDVEPLHQVRVATRRTRSALSELRSALPAETVGPFRDELRWLQRLTGPCRDLDVFTLEMRGHLARLPAPASDALLPVMTMLSRDRSEAWGEVSSGLRSKRFSSLIREWRSALDELRRTSGDAGRHRTVLHLADRRILKARARLVKRGQSLGDDPDPAALHRLRIDGKKLRYLLEFFRSLYPASPIAALVSELKGLQDVLGGYQDTVVQHDRLEELARRLGERGEGDNATFQAIAHLEEVLSERRRTHLEEFATLFPAFASASSRAGYESLFATSADTGGEARGADRTEGEKNRPGGQPGRPTDEGRR